ncbi:unnamed protein product [Caenorhabditis angaria]|uniref:Tetratricopeptide repeat protein 5 OB fold domain-containing protein n=1 Tax=Caenorhabditis angaria TaxID=860376 RepID=A0A9P1MU20_9PELO|nr:unnamed protein product [Caenorhabditis angaria]
MYSTVQKLKNFAEITYMNTKYSEDQAAEVIRKEAEKLINLEFRTVRGASPTLRTEIFLYSGKMFNCSEKFEPEAKQFLSFAVAENPTLFDGWLELGLCVAKQNDITFAVECFERSIKIARSPKGLANLAVALRLKASLSKDDFVQQSLREKAFSLLNEAIQSDKSLGLAHLTLGTHYFSEFFTSYQSKKNLLDEACSSYEQALKCDDQKRNPELHMNYATTLRYCEQFFKSIVHLKEACRLDPRNMLNSKEKLDNLLLYLEKLNDMIHRQGRLKTKRIESFAEALKNELCPTNASIMKVIGTVTHEEIVPLTIGCVLPTGKCCIVTVYNCSTDFGFIIGDTLTISLPEWKMYENIKMCRVNSPSQLLRNGQSVAANAIAHATLKIEQS